MRLCCLILLVLVLPSLGWAQSPSSRRFAHQVTIYRDTWGIPHVFGPTDASVVFGFGYAQAEDNFFRLEQNFIAALGRSAEVDGPDAWPRDRIVRALELPRLARAEYRRLGPRTRGLVDAFAQGVNYFLQTHPEIHPRLLERIQAWYPLAFIRYNYYAGGFLFSAGFDPSRTPADWNGRGAAANQGSNGWVVGPARSASGHPLLFINPHLPFFGPGQVYEGHLHSDEGWDFTGYTRFGFPFPYVGHNAYLGWVSTDNAADQADLYAETFDDPGNPLSYRYGDGHRRAVEWTDTLRVRSAGGLEVRVVQFRKTHHGPIVQERDGKLLAVRMAHLADDGWLAEWHAMTRARNLVEFQRAVAPLAMLFGNIMYADRDGHTWYLYNGAVPRRDTRFDWQAPLDGSDPATEWRGYHTMEELPQLTDPPTGWMQNCNSSPFLLTSEGNPDPVRFPAYMVPEGDNPRALISRRILASREKFTFEEWAEAAFDTRVVMADSLLPGLLTDADADTALQDRIAPAVAELRAWDHRSAAGSVAMSLFTVWRELSRERAESGAPAHERVAALAAAVDSLSAGNHGDWRVPYGARFRLQRLDEASGQGFSDDRPSLPAPGVNGGDGAVFTMYGRPVAGQRLRYAVAGATYVSLVEFGPTVRAVAIHTFGASGDPASPHFFDQAPLYLRGEFRPAWFALKDIRDHLEAAYHPGKRPTH